MRTTYCIDLIREVCVSAELCLSVLCLPSCVCVCVECFWTWVLCVCRVCHTAILHVWVCRQVCLSQGRVFETQQRGSWRTVHTLEKLPPVWNSKWVPFCSSPSSPACGGQCDPNNPQDTWIRKYENMSTVGLNENPRTGSRWSWSTSFCVVAVFCGDPCFRFYDILATGLLWNGKLPVIFAARGWDLKGLFPVEVTAHKALSGLGVAHWRTSPPSHRFLDPRQLFCCLFFELFFFSTECALLSIRHRSRPSEQLTQGNIFNEKLFYGRHSGATQVTLGNLRIKYPPPPHIHYQPNVWIDFLI